MKWIVNRRDLHLACEEWALGSGHHHRLMDCTYRWNTGRPRRHSRRDGLQKQPMTAFHWGKYACWLQNNTEQMKRQIFNSFNIYQTHGNVSWAFLLSHTHTPTLRQRDSPAFTLQLKVKNTAALDHNMFDALLSDSAKWLEQRVSNPPNVTIPWHSYKLLFKSLMSVCFCFVFF